MADLMTELANEATRGMQGASKATSIAQSAVFCWMVHPKTGAVVQLIADPQVILTSLVKGFVLVLNSETGLRAKLICGYDLLPGAMNDRQGCGICGEDKDAELQHSRTDDSSGETEPSGGDDHTDKPRRKVSGDTPRRSSRKSGTSGGTDRKRHRKAGQKS